MLTSDPKFLLDRLVEASIAEFDIRPDVFVRAVARYQALGNWLADFWDEHPSGGVIYPQGSMRLGTMVAPVTPNAEYDVDLVCRRDIAKESTTQKELKADVGSGVAAFVASGTEGDPRQRERKRCWTLDYPGEPFHMDVLPAVPDVEAQPNGILLTDRELVRWQRSNPVDFAEWFYTQMDREYGEVREALAKQMDVEQVPAWRIKTTLQRSVQALKRHRDLHFTDAPEDRPASIIITTLAARAYQGSGPLYEVLMGVTERIPSLIEKRNGVWWVANPVQSHENFADRWNTEPGSAERFFQWLEQARLDFAAIGEQRGVDHILARIATSFGEQPMRATAEKYGSAMRKARDAEKLGVSGRGGTLGPIAAKSRPVRPHVFHGDARS